MKGAKGFHGFCSPMVNSENQDLCGGWAQDYCTDTRIAERLIGREKPLGSMVGYAELTERLRSRLIKDPRLVVGEVREGHATWDGRMLFKFVACQRGTLGVLFDLEALAGAYRACGLPGIADHILGRDNFAGRTLESYFEDWDWQDAVLAKPPRPLTVRPWETGLILGYPIRETMARCHGVLDHKAQTGGE